MIRDVKFILAAPDTWSEWVALPIGKYDFWRILAATGTVTLQLDEDMPERVRKMGDWGTIPEMFTRVRAKSTVAETVVVTVGNEREGNIAYFNAAAGSSNVLSTPVGPDLMEWPIGSGLYVPNTSSNGLALNVGGRVTTLGIYTAGQDIDVRAYGMLRLTSQAGSPFVNEALTLVDSGDITRPPVPIYDAQFRLLSKTGRIPFDPTAPEGSVFYADLRGIAQIGFEAGGQGSVAVYLEPNWEPAQAPEDEILYATYNGSGPAGSIIIPAVVGRKIRVYGYRFNLSAADTVRFEDGAGTVLSSRYIAKTEGQEDSVKSLFETAVGQSLKFVATIGYPDGSVQVRYSLKEA